MSTQCNHKDFSLVCSAWCSTSFALSPISSAASCVLVSSRGSSILRLSARSRLSALTDGRAFDPVGVWLPGSCYLSSQRRGNSISLSATKWFPRATPLTVETTRKVSPRSIQRAAICQRLSVSLCVCVWVSVGGGGAAPLAVTSITSSTWWETPLIYIYHWSELRHSDSCCSNAAHLIRPRFVETCILFWWLFAISPHLQISAMTL